MHLDKKNMVRNLVRAFIRYFLDKERLPLINRAFFVEQNENQTKVLFKEYFTKRKFNNLVLKELIKHALYGAIFHQFLGSHSLNYLKNSNVKAKDNHYKFF